MIKKNTKIVIEGDEKKEWTGGIPLSVGEIMHIHEEDGTTADYEVAEKNVDCYIKGDDQNVDVVYVLKKKE